MNKTNRRIYVNDGGKMMVDGHGDDGTNKETKENERKRSVYLKRSGGNEDDCECDGETNDND